MNLYYRVKSGASSHIEGDCAIVAIAIVTNKSYNEIAAELAKHGVPNGHGTPVALMFNLLHEMGYETSLYADAWDTRQDSKPKNTVESQRYDQLLQYINQGPYGPDMIQTCHAVYCAEKCLVHGTWPKTPQLWFTKDHVAAVMNGIMEDFSIDQEWPVWQIWNVKKIK